MCGCEPYRQYNDTSAPVQRFEVDGTAYLHGSLIFDNSNGESDLLVLDNNPTARPNTTVPFHLDLRRIWSLRPWEVSNQTSVPCHPNLIPRGCPS